MIYIYNCFAGTHSSSLASAIHLNKLPMNRIPENREILDTDYFDKLTSKDMGRFIFRGTDERGDKVYTMGRGSSTVIVPCLVNFLQLLQDEFGLQEKILFSNMTSSVTPAMAIGGYISRRLGIPLLGVPLLLLGAKQAYRRITKAVQQTKEAGKSMSKEVLILSNEDIEVI